jgi:hypothetical protein
MTMELPLKTTKSPPELTGGPGKDDDLWYIVGALQGTGFAQQHKRILRHEPEIVKQTLTNEELMSNKSNISDTTIVSTRHQITIAEAKAQLSLVDEAEKRDIALTVRGELHVCCCPFHGETTPSFNIYPDDHYHCYGCGAHGDVIEFITRHDEITIPELLTQLTTDGQIIPGAAPSKAIREKRPEPLVIMPVPADAPRLIGIDRRTRDVMKPYVAPGEKATVLLSRHGKGRPAFAERPWAPALLRKLSVALSNPRIPSPDRHMTWFQRASVGYEHAMARRGSDRRRDPVLGFPGAALQHQVR